MPNPITGKDLFKGDGVLDAAIMDLQRFEEQFLATARNIQTQAKQNAKAIKEGKKATESSATAQAEAAKEADKLARAYVRYKNSAGEAGRELAELRLKQRQQNTALRNQVKIANSAEGSYNRLSAQYAVNKVRLNAMTKEERRAAEASEKLVSSTKAIYEEMKVLQAETGKTALNVGNYKESFSEAINEMQAFPGAAGGVVGGIDDIASAGKALLRNPLLLAMAALVGTLSAVYDGFRKSATGSRFLAQSGATVRGVLDTLSSKAGELGVSLVEAFSNPVESIKGLGESIGNNLLNRFKSIPSIVVNTGKAIKENIVGTSEEAKNSIDNLTASFVQLTTGLNPDQQAAFKDEIKETRTEAERAAEAYRQIDQARFEATQSNRALAKASEIAATEEAKLLIVADDTTKSFAEREQAAEEARKATERRSSKEMAIARTNLSLINQEIDIRKSLGQNVQDLLDSQLDAYRELAGAERDYTISVADNERTRSELKQDRLERDLDILIDGFDNQKTINEKLIADDAKTFDERRKILEETQQLSDDSFRKQIETIQEFTGVQVDANALITESDAIVLNQKIRSLGLSEIIEGRLLEIVRDRKSANQDLAESEAELLEAQKKAYNNATNSAIRSIDDQRKAQLSAFGEKQALAKSEFALLTKTEEEKKIFALSQQKERLKEELKLAQEHAAQLAALSLVGINIDGVEIASEDRLQTIKNLIAGIDKEIQSVGQNNEQKQGLFDLLGINIDDGQKQALKSAFDFAKDQLIQFYAQRTALANERVNEANQTVQSAEAALQAEITREEQGLASRTGVRERELQQAKATQKKAQEEQRKAARAERRIQSIQQASNLVTASAKIFAQLGFPAALPAIGIMLATFAATKISAGRLAKRQLRHGKYEVMNYGTPHGYGGDISLGQDSQGVENVAERGEGIMVVPATRARQYSDILPGMFKAIQSGKLMRFMSAASDQSQHAIEVVAGGGLTDTGNMESSLSRIASNTDRQVYTDGLGRTVVREGTVTTIYT